MKPAPFEYVRAATPEKAVRALAEKSGDARVLAGGQSLVLEMSYRRERPERLVDINGVAGLDRLDSDGGSLRVGALVRHRRFEERVEDGPLGRLLAEVSRYVAHPPVRNRGTFVGSLAYAHPAAEWPAICVALGAEIELLGPGGARTVPAGEFFWGAFVTAREPDELLTGVNLPLLGADFGVGFAEHRRTHASYATVAVVVALKVREGEIFAVRVGLANAADRPLRAGETEEFMIGRRLSPETFEQAGKLAAGRDASPRSEPHASAEYKRRAVAVLIRRAAEQAAGRAGGLS